MKTIILFAIIVFVSADTEYYDLEKVDMSEIVRNTDELKRFVNCELDRIECIKPYSAYRAVTLESVQQACKKCTPYQKHSFWVFLQGVTAKFPSDYVNFRHKYDPENKYFDALEAELEKYSVAYSFP